MSRLGELLLKQNSPIKTSSNFKTVNTPTSYSGCLLVRKMNKEEKSNDKIKKVINEYMNSPEKFLSLNSNVIVGKKIKNKKINEMKPEINTIKKAQTPYKRISNSKKYPSNCHILKNNNNNENSDKKNDSNNCVNCVSFRERQQKKNDKYEIIDNEQLKKIFNKYKICNSQSNDKKNNFVKIKNIKLNDKNKKIISKMYKIINEDKSPKKCTLTHSLSFQDNRLQNKQQNDKKIKMISKHLAKFIHKNESDLLINKSDYFCFKKEILKEIEFNKTSNEQYGIHNWNISLRRPKNFKGIRKSYINLTRENNPFWGIVIEKVPKVKETAIKPGSFIKNKKFFDKFKKTHFPLIHFNDFKYLENMDTLTVKGKNLFKIEYDREINNNKCKKKLYKNIYDEGKDIANTDINNVMGEKIFYEKYNHLFLNR